MIKFFFTLLCIIIISHSCNLMTGSYTEDYPTEPPLIGISNIDLQHISDTSVKIVWDASSESSDKIVFTVERKETNGSYKTVISNLEHSSYIDTRLEANKDYFYRVYAKISDNLDSTKLHINFGQSNNTIFSFHSTSFIQKLSFSQDGQFLAGSGNDFLYVWNTSDWGLEKVIDVNGGWVSDHTFCSGGRKIIYALDSTVFILSTTDWGIEKQMNIDRQVKYLSVTPDERRILIGASSGLIEVYDFENDSYILEIDSLKYLYGLLTNPDNETLTSFSYGLMRIYSISSGDLIKEVENISEFFHSPRFNQDSTEMVVLKDRYGSRTIEIYDTHSWSLINRIYPVQCSNWSVYTIDFIPNKSHLVYGDDNFVRIYNRTTDKVIQILSNGTKQMRSIVYSPRGNEFAAVNNSGQLKVWSSVLSDQWCIVD